MSHARLSPSSGHRWMVCPGSVREEAKYPGDSSGPAAIDGTHSHTLLEHCINNGLMDPMLMVDKELEDHEGAFVVDAARAARVVVAVNYIKDRQTQMTPCRVNAEEKVDAGQWFDRDDMAGTADVSIIGNGMIEVIDYKDGMTPVSAVGNPQMGIYLGGKLAGFRDAMGQLPPGKVRMTIIQPKLAVKGMDPISSHEIDINEHLSWIHNELGPAAAATDDPNAPLVPGEAQCKWCRAKGGCKALANKALKEAQVMFEQVDMAKQAADKDPNDLTDDQIRDIMEAAPLIKQFLEAVDAEAMRRFETGHAVPGLKVVRGRGSRSWSLSEEEMENRLKRMGLPKSVIWQTKLISPAQAEKASWEKKSKGEMVKKSLSERQLATLEKEYIKTSKGKLTVVPESDHRQAVPMAAEHLFANTQPTETAEPEIPAWLQGA